MVPSFISKLPSSTLLILKMACEMRDEAKWVEKQPTGMSSRAVIAVILAAAASEAFINELAAEVQKTRDLASGLIAFGSVMKEIEDNRGSLALKYLVASQALSGKMFDRGAQPFQDFDLLRRLRDLLMHVKSPDVLRDLLPPPRRECHSLSPYAGRGSPTHSQRTLKLPGSTNFRLISLLPGLATPRGR